MEPRERFRLAHAISEWDSILTSIDALAAMGERVPFSVVSRARRELNYLCALWRTERIEHFDLQDYVVMIVDEARAYFTQHSSELPNEE